MATIFKREEKADILFEKILQNPEACRRLTETFYSELNIDPDILEGYLPPEKFARALFSAYKNRDITELLMAICQNSMFDLLRNSFLAPFRFNEDGNDNPVLLTDEDGRLLKSDIKVAEKDYLRFKKVFEKRAKSGA